MRSNAPTSPRWCSLLMTFPACQKKERKRSQTHKKALKLKLTHPVKKVERLARWNSKLEKRRRRRERSFLRNMTISCKTRSRIPAPERAGLSRTRWLHPKRLCTKAQPMLTTTRPCSKVQNRYTRPLWSRMLLKSKAGQLSQANPRKSLAWASPKKMELMTLIRSSLSRLRRLKRARTRTRTQKFRQWPSRMRTLSERQLATKTKTKKWKKTVLAKGGK